jgi:hypothetical protein
MKLYQYTILKTDGTKEILPPCKKKNFNELYKIIDCDTIEIIPPAYYAGLDFGRCTILSDEEARFKNKQRNPHFNVLKGDSNLGEPAEWDVLGNVVKEDVYHEKNK